MIVIFKFNIFDSSVQIVYGVYFLIDILPAALLHFQYYLKNKNDLLEINNDSTQLYLTLIVLVNI